MEKEKQKQMENPTPLNIISRRIVDALDKTISEKLMQWRMFGSGPFMTTDYYGKSIQYSWVQYEGSPRQVFINGFIEPFLENGIVKSFNDLDVVCKEKSLEPDNYIIELKNIIKPIIGKYYFEIAEIDQLLRGKGNPRSVTAINVSDKILCMENFLDDYVVALMHKSNIVKSDQDNEIFELKPSFYGLGIDLKALWKRIFG